MHPAEIDARPRIDRQQLATEQLKYCRSGIVQRFARAAVRIQHADAVTVVVHWKEQTPVIEHGRATRSYDPKTNRAGHGTVPWHAGGLVKERLHGCPTVC